jgi:ubiquitin-conjugating enzyme E2 Q
LLQKDLVSYAKKTGRKAVVELEMKFPKDYPMNPPFVRILRPRFQFLTGMKLF